MRYRIESHVRENIYEFLCTIPCLHKKDEERLRHFVEAIGYITRSGCQ